MSEELKFQKLDPPERKRTYHFADRAIHLENIVAVCVRPSGTHRVETADGHKWIIAPGWLAIEIEVDKWTF